MQMRHLLALRLGKLLARRRCPFVASRWNKRKQIGYEKDPYRRVTMRESVHLTQLREMNMAAILPWLTAATDQKIQSMSRGHYRLATCRAAKRGSNRRTLRVLELWTWDVSQSRGLAKPPNNDAMVSIVAGTKP